MSGDVEKWVEEGARAACDADRIANGWPPTRTMEEFRDCGGYRQYVDCSRVTLAATVAAAEADGVVLVRVPDVKEDRNPQSSAQGWQNAGWNACRAAMMENRE